MTLRFFPDSHPLSPGATDLFNQGIFSRPALGVQVLFRVPGSFERGDLFYLPSVDFAGFISGGHAARISY